MTSRRRMQGARTRIHARVDARIDARIDAGRRRLVAALGAGAFVGLSAFGPLGLAGCAGTFGRRPEPMAPDESVWRAEGAFTVNGRAADADTSIVAGDRVGTGAGGPLVFAVDRTAFLMRPRSRLRLIPDPDAPAQVGGIALEAGGLLTVFARRTYRLETPLAVIGIRGTGVYAQVETGQDYVCTCYGDTEIAARADPASRETIASVRHDAPRRVMAGGASGTRVQPAPFRDHSDEELLLIESLMGRSPPYPVPGDAYGMPRRASY